MAEILIPSTSKYPCIYWTRTFVSLYSRGILKLLLALMLIGKPTGELDVMIAAVARSRYDRLVTNNTKHFINISGLDLENWIV